MLTESFRQFLRDERGGYTIWSLVWFMLYVAIGGLAVDVTDAYRMRTLLQSTADAAALAGVMSLPDQSEAVSQATAYAFENMQQNTHGTVLRSSEVYVGTWDFDTETFTAGTADPNAVYVITRRADANENALGMNFLRILAIAGLDPRWNINTDAVAVRYIPDCISKNGLVAMNKVDVTSNNHFNDICVHGQNAYEDQGQDYAIDIQNNNIIDAGTQFSMPDLDDMNGRPNVYDNNQGLESSLVEGDLIPKDAMEIDEIISDYQALASGGTPDDDPAPIPDYILLDANGKPLIKHVNNAQNFAGPYEPGYIYNMDCAQSNQQIKLPAGSVQIIEDVVIVADCQIQAASGVSIRDATIVTSALGNGQDPRSQNSINFPSDAQLGDGVCDSINGSLDGTGIVHIYSAASIHIAAGPDVFGLRMVAGGNIQFTANGDVGGISAEAGNNILATANGDWTFCPVAFDGPFAWHYRLVR